MASASVSCPLFSTYGLLQSSQPLISGKQSRSLCNRLYQFGVHRRPARREVHSISKAAPYAMQKVGSVGTKEELNPLLTSPVVPKWVQKAVSEQPWRGALEAPEESSYTVDSAAIEGTVPEELHGTMYRAGPGRIRIGDHKFGHWFDGDGMVYAVSFNGPGGEVSYRNRWMQTDRFKKQERSGKDEIVGKAVWTESSGGWLANLGPPGNPANTSVRAFDHKVLALAEGGPPLEINPQTLDTLGAVNYTPSFFSAHPKIDPDTKILYNVGIGRDWFRIFALDLYSLSPKGKVLSKARVALDEPTFVHDFAISENYLVVVITPHLSKPANLLKAVAGLTTFGATFEYQSALGTRIVVARKSDLSVVADVRMPAFATFHYANAYEEHGKLHVLVNRLNGPRENLEDTFKDMYARGWSWDTYHSLWELALDTKTWTLESDRPAVRSPRSGKPAGTFGMEYPQINQAYTGKKTRYVYVAACSTAGRLEGPQQGVHLGQSFGGVKREEGSGRDGVHYFDCIQKYDLETGTVQTNFLEERLEPSEVEFVPRRGAVIEDDGYLISFVYNNKKHTTDVVVLDAAKVGDPPVCVVHLPTHVALTFHGNFVPSA